MSEIRTGGPGGRADAPAALFFDVDGTLMWTHVDSAPEGGLRDILPSPAVYEAFKELRRRGHLTFLCTGRALSLVDERILALGFDGCISGAGSCVSFGDRIVYESVIDPETVLAVTELLLNTGATAIFESREMTLVLSSILDKVEAFPEIPVAKSVEELRELAPDLSFCKIARPLYLEGGAAFESEEVTDFLMRHFDKCDMGLEVEFTQKGVTKGTGIVRAMACLGRGLENTFAFGDSENDLPMFDVVETKVAMGNAMQVLKDRADYVTLHVKEDGVPHALRRFGLI